MASSRTAAIARLAAVPAAALAATATPTDAAAVPLNPAALGTYDLAADLEYGFADIDIDGDGLFDFTLSHFVDYGDVLTISFFPDFLEVEDGDGVPVFLEPVVSPFATNATVVELENPYFIFGPYLPVALFDAAGDSINLPGVTLDAVTAELFDADGTPLIDTLAFGSFGAETFEAVLYEDSSNLTDSIFDAALQPGHFIPLVFDIPGGSPYLAQLNFTGVFDGDGALTGVTLEADSSFAALPEPTTAAIAGLAGLACLGRRRRG